MRCPPRAQTPPPESTADFLLLARDQYIPAGDIGIWQAALRDPSDARHSALLANATERRSFTVELLYTDQVGGQRTISRFGCCLATTGVGRAPWPGTGISTLPAPR